MAALLTAAALGLLIGMVVGGFGGGGGVLTVPALVYVLGQNAHDATTGSVLIVGITSLAGVVARWRCIDRRVGLTFGAVGIPAAWLGSLLNRHAGQPVLLLAFAVLTLVAAAAMLLGTRDAAGPPARSAGGAATATVAVPPHGRAARAVRIAAWGATVGFLTGFLGVGGGFLVVPALVVALQVPMRTAVGTSLLVIVVNAVASVAARAGDLSLDWAVVAPFTLAAVAASLVGKRIADHLSGVILTRSFALMLAAVGLVVAAESVASI